MDFTTILIIGLAVFVLGYVGLIIVRLKIKKKQNAIDAEQVKNNLKEVDGVRYTKEENTLTETNEVNITHLEGDIVLGQNEIIIASANGKVKPGKYVVLSADEKQDKFNLRVGVYVREYTHNQEIVLAEGETISAVSGKVILR